MIEDSKPLKTEKVEFLDIRFRTLGCYPLTAGIISNAKTVKEIIKELQVSKISERNGRFIDWLILFQVWN